MTKRKAIIMGAILLAASVAGTNLTQDQLNVFAGLIDSVIGIVQQ